MEIIALRPLPLESLLLRGPLADAPHAPPPNPYKRHRLPAEIIGHCVWLYCRFSLSYRDGEELMAERGGMLPYDAVRSWGRQCGHTYAKQVRRRRPRPGDTWPLDEVLLTIRGARHTLWRAVDQDGPGLDRLVPRRRDRQAAERFCRKRLKGLTDVPRGSITDQRQSSRAARRGILPRVDHRWHRYGPNRAEHAHPPPRPRERRLGRFMSSGHAPRLLSAYAPSSHHVRPRRPRLPAPKYRRQRPQPFQTWREVTGPALAASTASGVSSSCLSTGGSPPAPLS